VPVILGIDRAVEHSSPETALGREVGGVEHDDLMVDAHRLPFCRDDAPIFPDSATALDRPRSADNVTA
jgi:hypothetical protein